MKHTWIIPLIAAIAVGALAFTVTRRACCGRAGATLDRLQDLSYMSHELHLSGEQVVKLQALHAALGHRLGDCCARHCAARARLGQALVSATNDDVLAEACLAEMGRAYEESERITLGHIRQVRSLLDPDQRKRFDEMIAGCMGGICSMPGGMPASREAACCR